MALAGDSAEGDVVTAGVIAKAGQEIVRALKGNYMTPEGKRRPVCGDITKAIYAPNLSTVARRRLYNFCAISRDIGGTQEVRRRAKPITNSIRIAFGLPSLSNSFLRCKPQCNYEPVGSVGKIRSSFQTLVRNNGGTAVVSRPL